jgi:3-methyladenine DNA glycosylase AlkD
MHSYVSGLDKVFWENSNKSNAIPMKAYMRNQFEFYGLKSDERRLIFKTYLHSIPLPDENSFRKIVSDMWLVPEREMQYCAIELLVKSKKFWNENDIVFFESLITSKAWWDTVDTLANHVVGPWFKKNYSQINSVTSNWNKSNNIWLQRMSILFQLKYKTATDLMLLSKYINHLSKSKEFFVQKAIGWTLREYAKTDPMWVQNFLNENKLMPLSEREAKKRL